MKSLLAALLLVTLQAQAETLTFPELTSRQYRNYSCEQEIYHNVKSGAVINGDSLAISSILRICYGISKYDGSVSNEFVQYQHQRADTIRLINTIRWSNRIR